MSHFGCCSMDTDYVVRFCKDVETRSQSGYDKFGRLNDVFVAGSGQYNFVQVNYTLNCWIDLYIRNFTMVIFNYVKTYSSGGLECICNVTFDSKCRINAELAIPCKKLGARVFEGLTVGFRLPSWEIVYIGMTQHGYNKAYNEYSFGKDLVQVSPDTGLGVTLSGSGVTGSSPTTLSPMLLNIDWTYT
ncbi:uncharacterized protein [Rutidosis leptorrhynchoides]|uniref:uncharacterized protein n=1 Tax=Rutidosis leptorrhynchoides TaxID=125765 RepID=UPI003A99337B